MTAHLPSLTRNSRGLLCSASLVEVQVGRAGISDHSRGFQFGGRLWPERQTPFPCFSPTFTFASNASFETLFDDVQNVRSEEEIIRAEH